MTSFIDDQRGSHGVEPVCKVLPIDPFDLSRPCGQAGGPGEAVEPDEAAIEETFVNTDARATLKLGQARGVVMLAPASLKIPVSEYAPNTVKKSVVGAGHAEKAQVKHMVKMLLPRAEMKSADSVDALAIAICHAHHRGSQRLINVLARS